MRDERLASEDVVIQAPMSYAGSAGRLWRPVRHQSGIVKALLGSLVVVLILVAWIAVTAWYVVFGLLLVPYRVLRRGSRKRKRDALRHRELLER